MDKIKCQKKDLFISMVNLLKKTMKIHLEEMVKKES